MSAEALVGQPGLCPSDKLPRSFSRFRATIQSERQRLRRPPGLRLIRVDKGHRGPQRVVFSFHDGGYSAHLFARFVVAVLVPEGTVACSMFSLKPWCATCRPVRRAHTEPRAHRRCARPHARHTCQSESQIVVPKKGRRELSYSVGWCPSVAGRWAKTARAPSIVLKRPSCLIAPSSVDFPRHRCHRRCSMLLRLSRGCLVCEAAPPNAWLREASGLRREVRGRRQRREG